jgi:hypothetical protein
VRRNGIPAGLLSIFLCWNTVSAGVAGVAQAAPEPELPALLPGQVLRLDAVAGTGTATADYGIGATDLCEFMQFPSGTLQVCGDSFAGQGVGFGGWHSPIALHVVGDSLETGDVRYDGVTGVESRLLAEPTAPGTSQLPAGVIEINRENWLMVTTTRDLQPQTSRLVRAIAGQGNWQTVPGSVRNDGYAGGAQSQISGYYDPIPTPDSPRGWVYIVADDFDRSAPVHLYRATPQTFTDRAAWQGWTGTRWGGPAAPLWQDRIGEMSVRQIDGRTVLSYFNATTGNMEIRVANDPTGLGTAPVTTVVVAAPWPDPPEDLPPPEDNRLAQPYGGYLSPTSTLEAVRVFVSQWNTLPRGGTPYRVIQYAVHPITPP